MNSNVDYYETLIEFFINKLNMFASLKKKRIREDHAPYMYKALRTPLLLELDYFLKVKSNISKIKRHNNMGLQKNEETASASYVKKEEIEIGIFNGHIEEYIMVI